MSKVFISGSISIKRIPKDIVISLKKIQKNKLEVLVGDALGIDKAIQDYFMKSDYNDICVYSIYPTPRNLSSPKFCTKMVEVTDDLKSEREKQTLKDKAMTEDSDYSLVIWDGKSRGSYQNILRALELRKKIKVYLTNINQFIEQEKVSRNEISFIYRDNNGYSAKEVVEYLANEGKEHFKSTKDLNKYLIEQKIIEKSEGVYIPISNENLFIVDRYKGKVSGLKFKNQFFDWLESSLSLASQQNELF